MHAVEPNRLSSWVSSEPHCGHRTDSESGTGPDSDTRPGGAILVEVPDFVANAISWFGFLPGAPLTRDQWLMLQHDNVASGKLPGFKAFGLEPTPLAAAAPEWLGRFRKGGRFAPSKNHQAAA